jgi:hypothetical protein
MLKGSCACGQVRYEIRGDLLGPITYCHCWRCRKQSGSSFGTTAGLKATALAFVAGEDLMQSWESSPGVRRLFASCCGCPIHKHDDADPEELGFCLGTLDSNPYMKAEMHYSVGSKAPWVEIEDALPQNPGGPPFVLRD